MGNCSSQPDISTQPFKLVFLDATLNPIRNPMIINGQLTYPDSHGNFNPPFRAHIEFPASIK